MTSLPLSARRLAPGETRDHANVSFVFRGLDGGDAWVAGYLQPLLFFKGVADEYVKGNPLVLHEHTPALTRLRMDFDCDGLEDCEALACIKRVQVRVCEDLPKPNIGLLLYQCDDEDALPGVTSDYGWYRPLPTEPEKVRGCGVYDDAIRFGTDKMCVVMRSHVRSDGDSTYGKWHVVWPFVAMPSHRISDLVAAVAASLTHACLKLKLDAPASVSQCFRPAFAGSHKGESYGQRPYEPVCVLNKSGDVLEWCTLFPSSASIMARCGISELPQHGLFGDASNPREYCRRVLLATSVQFPGQKVPKIPCSADAVEAATRVLRPELMDAVNAARSARDAQFAVDPLGDLDALHRAWLSLDFQAPHDESMDAYFARQRYVFYHADDDYDSSRLEALIGDAIAEVSLAAQGLLPDEVPERLEQKLDETVVAYINRFYAHLRHVGKECHVVRCGKQFRIVQDIKSTLLHGGMIKMKIPGSNKTYGSDIYKVWCHSVRALWFNQIVCENPEVADAKDYNIWRGFDIDAREASRYANYHMFGKRNKVRMDAKSILNHYFNVFAGRDEAVFQYLVKWFAKRVQQPFTKLIVTPVFISQEGTGKDLTLTRIFRSIIGEHHSMHCADPKEIFGRFNSVLEGKVLVFLDEVESISAADKNKFRSHITDPTLHIERKYHESYETPNLASYVIHTNNDKTAIVDITAQQRRYFFISARSEVNTQPEYFADLVDFLGYNLPKSDPNYLAGVKAVANFFYSVDVSDFDERAFPVTEALVEQFELNKTPVVAWMTEVMKAGKIDATTAAFDSDWSGTIVVHNNAEYAYDVTKCELYTSHTLWCKSHNYPCTTDGVFWKTVKSLWPVYEYRGHIEGLRVAKIMVPTLQCCQTGFVSVYRAMETLFPDAKKPSKVVEWKQSPVVALRNPGLYDEYESQKYGDLSDMAIVFNNPPANIPSLTPPPQ